MAARVRKSKRRSVASSGSTQPNSPVVSPVVFFIDRSLGKKIIAERLRDAGVTVEIHDDHFRQDALDQEWLSEVGKRGWIVLTKDDRIRYRPAELDAYQKNKVRVFIFGSGEIKAQEMAEAIAKAMAKVLRLVKRTPPPFFARISRSGFVSLL